MYKLTYLARICTTMPSPSKDSRKASPLGVVGKRGATPYWYISIEATPEMTVNFLDCVRRRCMFAVELLPCSQRPTRLTWRLIFHLLSFSFAFPSFVRYCSICSFGLPFPAFSLSYFTHSEEDSSLGLLYMQASLSLYNTLREFV